MNNERKKQEIEMKQLVKDLRNKAQALKAAYHVLQFGFHPAQATPELNALQNLLSVFGENWSPPDPHPVELVYANMTDEECELELQELRRTGTDSMDVVNAIMSVDSPLA